MLCHLLIFDIVSILMQFFTFLIYVFLYVTDQFGCVIHTSQIRSPAVISLNALCGTLVNPWTLT